MTLIIKSDKKDKYRNYFIIVLVILLLLANILSSIVLNSNSKLITRLNSQINNLHNTLILKDSTEVNQMLFDIFLSKNLNINVCKSILKDKDKILFVISKRNVCAQCVIEIIMDLNVLADKIGHDKVILSGDFEDRKSMNEYLSGINVNFKTFTLNEILIDPSTKINESFLFVLKPDYNIKYLFFVNDYNNNIKQTYFDKILLKHFSK